MSQSNTYQEDYQGAHADTEAFGVCLFKEMLEEKLSRIIFRNSPQQRYVEDALMDIPKQDEYKI